MKPIEFKEQNVIFAKNQPEYVPLPALLDKDRGQVISCWQLSIIERLQILFTGKLWLNCLTFYNPLQPVLLSTKRPFKVKK